MRVLIFVRRLPRRAAPREPRDHRREVGVGSCGLTRQETADHRRKVGVTFGRGLSYTMLALSLVANV
jgi:hypothetical protein